jgi:hypothetical protein
MAETLIGPGDALTATPGMIKHIANKIKLPGNAHFFFFISLTFVNCKSIKY